MGTGYLAVLQDQLVGPPGNQFPVSTTHIYTLALATGATTDAGGLPLGTTLDDLALVVSPVPEPGTFALGGLAAAGLAAWRRWRPAAAAVVDAVA